MIRKMELPDVSRVAEIHVFGWRSAFRGIISDEHLFNKMAVTRSLERFENALKDNIGETYVFDDTDGIIKAFMTICPCRDEDKVGAFELGGLYVEPLMKGQGIGSKLVEYCEKRAIERGYKEVCLWTLEKNVKSRKFYEKKGYSPEGTNQFWEPLKADLVRYCKAL